MRKVLFKKWVEGIELETTKGKSCQPWDRDYKQGTNCWTDFIHEGTFHDFMYNFGPHGEPYANIEYNGEMVYVEADKFKFIDKPEDERIAEFAKAAMQGIISAGGVYPGTGCKNAVEWADKLIAELKK